MDTAAVVQWFSDVFGSFDYSILQFYTNLHESALGKLFDAFFLARRPFLLYNKTIFTLF